MVSKNREMDEMVAGQEMLRVLVSSLLELGNCCAEPRRCPICESVSPHVADSDSWFRHNTLSIEN
ncbi:hypothetical protein LINGRAHAP2_LOCUS7445, partial [Linum grandiflorum]